MLDEKYYRREEFRNLGFAFLDPAHETIDGQRVIVHANTYLSSREKEDLEKRYLRLYVVTYPNGKMEALIEPELEEKLGRSIHTI